MAKFCVIIAAAGRSERFGGMEKKTFAKLDGRAIFLRSIEAFLNRDDICRIILAVAPEDIGEMKSSFGANLGFMGVKLVEGGGRRCDTVQAALPEVPAEADFVAIHDAARPCLRSEMIDAVFAQAQKTGGAILAAPIVGTIKRVGDSNTIDETVCRDQLHEAQTPQVFKKEWLLDAYQKLEDSAREGATDDAEVVARAGYAVAVVISDRTNIKITTKGDVTLANAILKARPNKPVRKFGAFEEAQW